MGWIERIVDHVIALTDARMSPGAEKGLISVPDPQVQTPTEFEIEKFLADYDNPRKMSKKWLEKYLNRPRPQLAIDVILAFDEKWKLQRQLARAKVTIWVMSLVVSPLIGEVVKLVFAHLVK